MDDLVKSNKHTIFRLIKEVFHKHSKAIQDGVVSALSPQPDQKEGQPETSKVS